MLSLYINCINQTNKTMTKKEELAMRYYTAATELNGTSFNDDDVKAFAKRHTAAWLEETASYYEKLLDEDRRKRACDEYLINGDGKKIVDRWNLYCDTTYDDISETYMSSANVLKDYLCDVYGRDDIMVTICDDHVTVGIRDDKDPNNFKFGHSFEINFNMNAFGLETDGQVRMSFSTMGYYVPLIDDKYCHMLRMLGDFSNNPLFLETTKVLVNITHNAVMECVKRRDAYEKWRQDPFDNEVPEFLNI